MIPVTHNSKQWTNKRSVWAEGMFLSTESTVGHTNYVVHSWRGVLWPKQYVRTDFGFSYLQRTYLYQNSSTVWKPWTEMSVGHLSVQGVNCSLPSLKDLRLILRGMQKVQESLGWCPSCTWSHQAEIYSLSDEQPALTPAGESGSSKVTGWSFLENQCPYLKNGNCPHV